MFQALNPSLLQRFNGCRYFAWGHECDVTTATTVSMIRRQQQRANTNTKSDYKSPVGVRMTSARTLLLCEKRIIHQRTRQKTKNLPKMTSLSVSHHFESRLDSAYSYILPNPYSSERWLVQLATVVVANYTLVLQVASSSFRIDPLVVHRNIFS